MQSPKRYTASILPDQHIARGNVRQWACVSELERLPEFGHCDPGAKLAADLATERIHRIWFTMHEHDRGPALEMPIPVEQALPVGMRGQAADGMHLCPDLDRLAPKPYVVRPVNEFAAERAPGLKSDDHYVRILAPDIVFEMVLDTAAGAHSATGDNDGA